MEAWKPAAEGKEGAQARFDEWVPGLSGGSSYGDSSSASGEVAVGGGRETPAGEEDTGHVQKEAEERGKDEKANDEGHEGVWRPLDLRRDYRLILGAVGVALAAMAVRTVVGSARKVSQLRERLEETEDEAKWVRMNMESTLKRERDAAEKLHAERVEMLAGMVQERNHRITALRRQLKFAEAKVLETVVKAFEDMDSEGEGDGEGEGPSRGQAGGEGDGDGGGPLGGGDGREESRRELAGPSGVQDERDEAAEGRM